MAGERLSFAFLQEPPFCFTDGEGIARGCDVDLAGEIAVRLGFAGLEPVEAEFADLLPGLRSGRWRMTTGLFVSDERRRLVDFTRPVWSLGDGLLVARGNPQALTGYRSVGQAPSARLAVIRDQVQHATALDKGVAADRISIFETQAEAAGAVLSGAADAYASVAMAHRGYLERNRGAALEVIDVPSEEKPPALGAFALSKSDAELRRRVDEALADVLGTPWHRAMMRRYGFRDADLDRLAGLRA